MRTERISAAIAQLAHLGRGRYPRAVRLGLFAFCAVMLAAAPAGATCRVDNVTPVAFGSYTSGMAMPLDSVGQLDVSCAGMAQVRILMGRGTGGSLSPRTLRSGSLQLSYGLYLDSARTAAWGDGTEGTSAYVGMLQAGQVTRIPVFGRIFGRQAIPAGRYTDQITVTIVF